MVLLTITGPLRSFPSLAPTAGHITQKPVCSETGFRVVKKTRRRPTLPLLRSTIGSPGLNDSVRNGKR